MVVPEPYHGSFGPIHGTFKSWQFQGWGAPKQRLLPDRHTHTRPHSHTRRGEFREPKRLKSFEKNATHSSPDGSGQAPWWAAVAKARPVAQCGAGARPAPAASTRRRPHACVSGLGGGVQQAMSPSVVQCVPDPPRGAWNLWRARTCGETERRTDFTAIPVSRGAESLAPRLRTTVNQITAKPEKATRFGA